MLPPLPALGPEQRIEPDAPWSEARRRAGIAGGVDALTTIRAVGIELFAAVAIPDVVPDVADE
jgi:hypothetical protein